MKSLKKYITLAIIAGLTSTLLAEPYSQGWESSNLEVADAGSNAYTLGWQDTAAPARAAVTSIAASAAAVEAPVVVNLAQLPTLIAAAQPAPAISPADLAALRYANRGRRLRGPSAVSVPTYDITFRADRYFDVWANNYRYVSRVEVVTYRGGFPRTEVYENSPQYSTYEVYINDLKAGDRYEVRVTWDDGKCRTIERNVTRYPEYNVRVSEPL